MNQISLMLVDDESRFLQTTKKLLLKEGFVVETAESGREALEKLAAGSTIHVVILDVKMPEMDGIETLKQIKRKFPMVEVIMLTGHATTESAVEGMRSGAIDYLMKPVEVEPLVVKVKEAFAKRMSLEEKIQEAKAQKAMHSSFSPM